MAQNARDWGKAICEALGLDPGHTNRIELVLDAKEPATLTVRIYPDKSAAVVELLKEAGKHVSHITVIDNEARHEFFDGINERAQRPLTADLPGGGDPKEGADEV